MFKDNKKLVVETMFIGETLKLNLSLKEFLVLLYFDNIYDEVFDMKIVAKTLNMKEEVFTQKISNLLLEALRLDGKQKEYEFEFFWPCFDLFYNQGYQKINLQQILKAQMLKRLPLIIISFKKYICIIIFYKGCIVNRGVKIIHFF